MSENGEEIINRLPDTSGLHRNLDARKVIENTIGAWFDNLEEQDWFSQFFLNSANGKYLDLHGQTFDIDNTLVSDNPYFNGNGFFGVAPDEVTKNILNKKFVLRNGVTWL